MFLDVDCVQLEVNPLAETPQGKVINIKNHAVQFCWIRNFYKVTQINIT
jgi:hypothetical protein